MDGLIIRLEIILCFANFPHFIFDKNVFITPGEEQKSAEIQIACTNTNYSLKPR